MALVVINCCILDVFPLMICVLLHIDYYIPLLNVTLIIRCMLWDMCHMLAERHVVVPLLRSFCMFKTKKKKKKKKGVVTQVFGNKHYERNCKLSADCCDMLITSRFCHDEVSDIQWISKFARTLFA